MFMWKYSSLEFFLLHGLNFFLLAVKFVHGQHFCIATMSTMTKCVSRVFHSPLVENPVWSEILLQRDIQSQIFLLWIPLCWTEIDYFYDFSNYSFQHFLHNRLTLLPFIFSYYKMNLNKEHWKFYCILLNLVDSFSKRGIIGCGLFWRSRLIDDVRVVFFPGIICILHFILNLAMGT